MPQEYPALITTLEEWDAIDGDQCTQGYIDGWRDDDGMAPGPNHPISYRHGWHVAQWDRSKNAPIEHRRLVHIAFARNRATDRPAIVPGAA